MYRIKNDKRTKRSIDRITQSLTECLDKKDLADISVAEIAEGAGVSRATFYRIFDTPFDVLDCLCETIAQELEKSTERAISSGEDDYTAHTIHFLIDHADKLKAIFRSEKMYLLEKAIRPRIEPMIPPSMADLTKSEKDYAKYSIAAILKAILYVWYEHGCKETASEMIKIFNKIRNGQNNIGN